MTAGGKRSILVADDESSVQRLLKDVLGKQGYQVLVASNGQEAIDTYVGSRPDLVLMDVRMPVMDGMFAFSRIKAMDPEAMVILMTAFAAVEDAVKALKEGAYDYLIKPFHIDEVKVIVKRGLEVRHLTNEVKSFRRKLADGYDNIIGKSRSMQKVFDIIERVADTNVTVLIRGESGTGKELVARAIHYQSPRRDKPFIKINCSAMPETLVESELFGHEKGAFTGAHLRKPGKFQLADGGTLLLDEIGEMNMATQAKLLRVLQEHEFERLGGTETIKIDVRVIAASNANLEEAIARKTFREDLYYRLNVVPLWLPPLRERREDIPDLVCYFLKKFTREFNREARGVSPGVMDLLSRYPWPGNIRELENTVKQAIILGGGSMVTSEHLPVAVRTGYQEGATGSALDSRPLREAVSELERRMIAQALAETGGNRTEAAKRLGLSRRALIYKIEEYRLKG